MKSKHRVAGIAVLTISTCMVCLDERTCAQPDEAGEAVVEPRQSTSVQDVLQANPIKLFVTNDAPVGDLPAINKPLGIKDAVQLGLDGNLSLKQFNSSWIVSKFNARSALGKLGPSVSFTPFYATSSLNQMLFFQSNDVSPMTMQPVRHGTSGYLLLGGYQPLFTGGRLLGGYKTLRAQEKQSLEAYHAERLKTALKIKEAYWEAAWNEASLQVATDYVKEKELTVSNMRARYEQGKVPKADYLREQSELARARSSLNDTYGRFNKSLVALKVVLGVNLASAIELRDRLEYVETPGALKQYQDQAMRNRPEIHEAQQRIAEMQSRRTVALSKYSPQLGVYGLGSVGFGSTVDSTSPVGGKFGGTIGVVGGVTLFDSGSRLNDVRAASELVRREEIAKRETELKVAQDVADSWIDLDLERRNVELAKLTVASAEEDYRLIHKRYSVGKAVGLEDYDAAVKVFQSRLSLQEALYKYSIAQSRLLWASGNL